LTYHDDGYAWNEADDFEKIELSKTASRRYGYDYIFWHDSLNDFYDYEYNKKTKKKLAIRMIIAIQEIRQESRRARRSLGK
jgi:hypothetical protein